MDVKRLTSIWKEDIEGLVVEGLERAGRRMEQIAKSNAPVRKSKRRGRKRKSGVFADGIELGFKDRETGSPVNRIDAEQRMRMARTRNKTHTAYQFSPLDVNEAGLELYIPKGTRANAAVRYSVSQANAAKRMQVPKIRLVKNREARHIEGETFSQTLKTTNYRGIFYNTQRGSFQYGGYLKAHIKADEEARKEGNGRWSIQCRSYAPYSRPVEYGRQKGKHGTTKGVFFMTKAVENTFDRIDALMGIPER